jgi:hypothetical protein
MSRLRERLDELAARGRTAPVRPPAPAPVPAALADLVGGVEVACDGARCWHIVTPFERICPAHTVVATAVAGPRGASEGPPLTVPPGRAFVVDIETGGLAGTPVFLIGVVALDEWPPVVHQWLARDYPEEPAILAQLAAWAARRDVWLSFNGRSFDEPFLRDRATLHRLGLPAAAAHFDLLHAARRRWRGALPNCRLGTLEEHVLGRPRVGDVPSADVPDLFHHFIRTGQAGPLRPVLEHNQLDLISCVELYVRLTEPV